MISTVYASVLFTKFLHFLVSVNLKFLWQRVSEKVWSFELNSAST